MSVDESLDLIGCGEITHNIDRYTYVHDNWTSNVQYGFLHNSYYKTEFIFILVEE